MKIHKIAASAALTLAAAGSIVFAGATPAGAYQITGPVTITPSASNLVNNQTVNISVANFGTDNGTLYVVECTTGVVSSKGDTSYCDDSDPTAPGADPSIPQHVVKLTATNGSASGKFQVHTGSNFLATHKGAKCDFQHSCILVVTDGQTAATTTYAGFAQVTFKDTRVATKTKVKAKKSAKVGAKLAVVATTTHKGSKKATGTVKFTDNGKKCGAAVKEKTTGKASGKCKVVKGKNTIVATYSGDANYKTSKGTAKVTGKKKK